MRLVIVLIVLAVVSGCGSGQEKSERAAEPQAAASSPMEMASPTATPGTAQKPRLIQQGVDYLQDANPVAAVHSFDEYIKQHPNDAQGYLILGQTYMRLNDYPRAIDTFTAATRIAPEQGEAYYLLAMNYGLSGNFEKAIESAQRSVELFRAQKDEQNFLRSLALMQGLTNARTQAQKSKDAPATATP